MLDTPSRSTRTCQPLPPDWPTTALLHQWLNDFLRRPTLPVLLNDVLRRVRYPPRNGVVYALNDEGFERHLAERLRVLRQRKKLSQRELARRTGFSASLISQIETGQSRPSVSTLYTLAGVLGTTVYEIFRTFDGSRPEASESEERSTDRESTSPVVRAAERQSIDLESGVIWEKLSPPSEPDLNFLHVVYEPGGSSSTDSKLMRHSGREYALILSGHLKAQVAFDGYELGPGDAISFESSTPHRYWNDGDVAAHGVWFISGA